MLLWISLPACQDGGLIALEPLSTPPPSSPPPSSPPAETPFSSLVPTDTPTALPELSPTRTPELTPTLPVVSTDTPRSFPTQAPSPSATEGPSVTLSPLPTLLPSTPTLPPLPTPQLTLVPELSPDPTEFPEPSSPSLLLPERAGYHLVVIHTDTLRRDHMPMYGYPRNTFPLLSRRPWVVVEEVRASSSWTAPSSASFFSGLDLFEHQVTYFVPELNGPGTANQPLASPTFMGHLQAAGYRTALFSGSGFVQPETGYGAGLDFFYGQGKDNGVSNAGQLLAQATQWWSVQGGSVPRSIFVQPMDAHDPHSPAAEDLGTWSDPEHLPIDLSADLNTQALQLELAYAAADEAGKAEITVQMNALYDEQLLGLDRSIEQFLTWLEANGWLSRTVVVITSDHGETLNNTGDGTFNHGRTVREELIRVPLLMLVPETLAQQQACLMSNMDTLPTVLEMLQVPEMPDIRGKARQQGCANVMVSSNFDLSGALYFANADDEAHRLTWNCLSGEVSSYDLVKDPAGLEDLGFDGAMEMPPTLWTELQQYVDAATQTETSLRCLAPMARPLPGKIQHP